MFVEAGVDNICSAGAIITSLKVKKDTDFRFYTKLFFKVKIENLNFIKVQSTMTLR